MTADHAGLEVRVTELENQMGALRQTFEQGFDAVERRFDEMDQRFQKQDELLSPILRRLPAAD